MFHIALSSYEDGEYFRIEFVIASSVLPRNYSIDTHGYCVLRTLDVPRYCVLVVETNATFFFRPYLNMQTSCVWLVLIVRGRLIDTASEYLRNQQTYAKVLLSFLVKKEKSSFLSDLTFGKTTLTCRLTTYIERSHSYGK